MIKKNIAQENKEMYITYNGKKGENRNSLLYNSEVDYQDFSQKLSKIKALRHISLNPNTTKVLDVGCGMGESLMLYLELGFNPKNLFGIDIWDEQIEKAQKRLPMLNLFCADATNVSYDDNSFDIVTESTMFLQMTDNELAKRIAGEMVRVVKKSGHLIITDWRYDKPCSTEFLAVNEKRIRYLFDVGTSIEIKKVFNGALVPPLGRFLSKYLPALYMPIKYMFPFTCGMVTYVLQKK